MKIDAKKFNDPLALEVSWGPASNKGQWLRSSEALLVGSNRLEFKKAFFLKLIPWFFIVPSLLVLYFTTITTYFVAGEIDYLIELTWAGPALTVLIIGISFLFASKEVIAFDKGLGYYWKGKQVGMTFDPDKQKAAVRLAEIRALQIISKLVIAHASPSSTTASGGTITKLISYELNLVLRSGERLNIVDHGRKKGLMVDAMLLSEFLNVPIWDASNMT